MHTPCCQRRTDNVGEMLAGTVPFDYTNTRRSVVWGAERSKLIVSVQFDVGNAPGAMTELQYRVLRADRVNSSVVFTSVGGRVASGSEVLAGQRNSFQFELPTGGVGIQLLNGFDVAIGNVEIIWDIIPTPVTERGPNPQGW